MMGFYPLLDRAPKGRNESGDPDFWIRRHDEYNAARARRHRFPPAIHDVELLTERDHRSNTQ